MRTLPESIRERLDISGTSSPQHDKQKLDCLKLQLYATARKPFIQYDRQRL